MVKGKEFFPPLKSVSGRESFNHSPEGCKSKFRVSSLKLSFIPEYGSEKETIGSGFVSGFKEGAGKQSGKAGCPRRVRS